MALAPSGACIFFRRLTRPTLVYTEYWETHAIKWLRLVFSNGFRTKCVQSSTARRTINDFERGGGECGPLEEHVDSLLLPHFPRYQKPLVISEILGHVVVTNGRSQCTDEWIVRKLSGWFFEWWTSLDACGGQLGQRFSGDPLVIVSS